MLLLAGQYQSKLEILGFNSPFHVPRIGTCPVPRTGYPALLRFFALPRQDLVDLGEHEQSALLVQLSMVAMGAGELKF
jgi:hypothetical protein